MIHYWITLHLVWLLSAATHGQAYDGFRARAEWTMLRRPSHMDAKYKDSDPCNESSQYLHIGGIFKDNETAQFFKQAVFRANKAMKRHLPAGFCLAPSAVVMPGHGSASQIKVLCEQLLPNRVYAIILTTLGDHATDELPGAPALISSHYQIPLISTMSQANEIITEREVYNTILRILPHKANEVESWCYLLSHFGLTHAVMITPNDAVGSEYEIRMRHCWWRANVIRYVQFLHWGAHAKQQEFSDLLLAIKMLKVRVILLYAEEWQARSLFDEARQQSMTGSGWLWIVSEYAAAAPNLPVGSLITKYIRPPETVLIEEAVTLIAYTSVLMLNTTWKDRFDQAQPTNACIQADDNKWYPQGRILVDHLRRGFYFNNSLKTAAAFDWLNFRAIAAYSIMNCQSPGTLVKVGTYDQTKQFFNRMLKSQHAKHLKVPVELFTRNDDYGFFMTSSFSYSINYALHTNDAEVDQSTHNFAEAIQKKVHDSVKELQKYECDHDALQLNDSAIVWPEATEISKLHFESHWHLRVVTIESVPFVYVFRNPRKKRLVFLNLQDLIEAGRNGTFEEFIATQGTIYNDPNTIVCPGLLCKYTHMKSGVTHDYCCLGYCVDLLIKLASFTNITFDLHLSRDGGFGHYVEADENDPTLKEELMKHGVTLKPKEPGFWSGMIGEVDYNLADMAVGPISIIPGRSRVVDFTKPFMYPTLSILSSRDKAKTTLGSFLYPFETSLWISLFVIVNGVAAFMYLLERYSPFGWSRNEHVEATGDHFFNRLRNRSLAFIKSMRHFNQRRPKEEDKYDKPVTLAEAVWLSWGIMLSTGPGEQLPRSSSSRLFTMVWAGFCMIVVASYTANLAAFLVLDRPAEAIKGIDDPRLRNPSSLFTFATVRNSDIELYFKRNVELATMYRFMQSRMFNNVDDAVNQVRNGSIDAFIWETSRLLYEATRDCRLTIASGGVFGKGQYAFALRKQLKQFIFFDYRLNANLSGPGNPLLLHAAESATAKQEPLVDALSLNIVLLHDSGYVRHLEEKWIFSKIEEIGLPSELTEILIRDRHYHDFSTIADESTCTQPSGKQDLKSILGIFYLLAVGTLIGTITLVFEVMYYRCRRRKYIDKQL